MKRLPRCLFIFLLLVYITGNAADIYVSDFGGNDYLNPGTKAKPLATIDGALRKARELRRLNDPSIAGGINIILLNTRIFLTQPIFIRHEDSGTADSPTIIRGADGNPSMISGGMELPRNRWEKAPLNTPGLSGKAKGKVWVLDVPAIAGKPMDFRQLWAHISPAIRARHRNADSMDRIIRWDKANAACVIPTPKGFDKNNIGSMEMLIHQWWEIAILRIKSAEVTGDSTKLFFHEPESRIQNEHPWPAPWMSTETGNSAFYLSNHLSFLDAPNEWYLDVAAKKLYYWPHDPQMAPYGSFTAPVLETLVQIEGTVERPVSHVYFKNISFRHSNWMRPSQQGHVPHQAGMYMTDAYKLKVPGTPDKKTLENQAWVGRPAAAVKVRYANHIQFDSCSFSCLSATALDFEKGTRDNIVNGNRFKDIGGSAILAGVFSEDGTEVHIPYNPSNEKDICSGMVITNNLITDIGQEDWGCVGIGAGYVRNARIENNEICDVPYTGISVGWGWTPTANAMKNNRISRNKIHHYGRMMYDVAAIYTLSAQPGTVISENYIDSIYKAPYAHIPNHWFYLYTDEGSSGITVENNWCPSEKFLQNANGPGNTWKNNGPGASNSIKSNAGLQAPYQYLSAWKENRNWPVNKEYFTIIELITGTKATLDTAKLSSLVAQNKVSPASLYQWKNHYTVFGRVPDLFSFRDKLKRNFPGVEIKTYDAPFYEFNRSYCSDTSTAKEWDHILLTANLVADPKLQNEYLDYHAAQFQQWPEISKGFCNADFQQLLLYRNGRQLMLVISIPKGESLDKLNPGTTENNPRMDEWNKIMKKYQEGIAGTSAGETWVFLKALE
jgi:hypothetical protein